MLKRKSKGVMKKRVTERLFQRCLNFLPAILFRLDNSPVRGILHSLPDDKENDKDLVEFDKNN